MLLDWNVPEFSEFNINRPTIDWIIRSLFSLSCHTTETITIVQRDKKESDKLYFEIGDCKKTFWNCITITDLKFGFITKKSSMFFDVYSVINELILDYGIVYNIYTPYKEYFTRNKRSGNVVQDIIKFIVNCHKCYSPVSPYYSFCKQYISNCVTTNHDVECADAYIYYTKSEEAWTKFQDNKKVNIIMSNDDLSTLRAYYHNYPLPFYDNLTEEAKQTYSKQFTDDNLSFEPAWCPSGRRDVMKSWHMNEEDWNEYCSFHGIKIGNNIVRGFICLKRCNLRLSKEIINNESVSDINMSGNSGIGGNTGISGNTDFPDFSKIYRKYTDLTLESIQKYFVNTNQTHQLAIKTRKDYEDLISVTPFNKFTKEEHQIIADNIYENIMSQTLNEVRNFWIHIYNLHFFHSAMTSKFHKITIEVL